MRIAYTTKLGQQIIGDSLEVLKTFEDDSIDLVVTSPPFALLREKEYGNADQAHYVAWLSEFGRAVLPKLKPTGSLVMDIGGAYKRGVPVRSLYPFRVLLKFCDELGYHLAEDFYWFNSSKLPSPIEWVNKRKIRVKDSVNNVWWFSKTEFPKADVSKVLTPYSDRMKKLLDNPEKYFAAKERPSGHAMTHNFRDNGGAIPPNLLQIPNSESNSNYLANCKRCQLKAHPARFPAKLPEFFVQMLTEPGDLVVDIFGGSNTTGFVAERLGRRWASIELSEEYAAMSFLRFLPKSLPTKDLVRVYYHLLQDGPISLLDFLTTRSVDGERVRAYLQTRISETREQRATKRRARELARLEFAEGVLG